ncbi:hypothetical protein WKI71_43400 [Streptomyces sp. MS1.AVA.1]|uniref:GNAT family N-acetyltransferase n=1 Tax=Streptomyces machairae TaxID=3134109 RepID=A0ABU8UUX9_9ACTN
MDDRRRPPRVQGRLTFAPASDEEFLRLFRRIAVGSLDEETRRNIAVKGAEATARDEMDFYLGCPGRREWWRVAHTPDGQVAGLALPSATPYARNVGYLGVVPEFRGHGYVDDLLTEITLIHAESGAELITATTDTGNAPWPRPSPAPATGLRRSACCIRRRWRRDAETEAPSPEGDRTVMKGGSGRAL